jgi:hypothetical protein
MIAACSRPMMRVLRGLGLDEFADEESLPVPSGWNPMHQQPPKMPLFCSTSAAKAGHVDSSSGRTL